MANDRRKLAAADPSLDSPTVFYSNMESLFGQLASDVFRGAGVLVRMAIIKRFICHLLPGAKRRGILPRSFDPDRQRGRLYINLRQRHHVELVPVHCADMSDLEFARFQRRLLMARPLLGDLNTKDKNLLANVHADAFAWLGCAILKNWLVLGRLCSDAVDARDDDDDNMAMERAASERAGEARVSTVQND